MSDQLRCERCKRFVGEDCLEGIDWGAGTNHVTGDVAWTGLYYCAAGKGCNVDMAEYADPDDPETCVGWPR